uniref:Transmembrane protein n=1 Tax=Zooxanthella nutricula TaxID=1333877 RepID=A0A7S2J1V0_9DINO
MAEWTSKFQQGEAVPIYVKKPFRVKAYTVASLQAWALFAITVAADYAIASYDSKVAGSLVIICASFALAGMTMMWYIRKLWPYNVLAGIATSLAVGAAWAIADAMDFWEQANIPGQMLGILGISYLVHIVVFAAIWDFHDHPRVFHIVALGGWCIGVICCLATLHWMERSLILAIGPALMVLFSSMVMVCTCKTALTNCGVGEDDYMVVAVTTTANLLVFLSTFCLYILVSSGGYWGHVYGDVAVGTGREDERTSESENAEAAAAEAPPATAT